MQQLCLKTRRWLSSIQLAKAIRRFVPGACEEQPWKNHRYVEYMEHILQLDFCYKTLRSQVHLTVVQGWNLNSTGSNQCWISIPPMCRTTMLPSRKTCTERKQLVNNWIAWRLLGRLPRSLSDRKWFTSQHGPSINQMPRQCISMQGLELGQSEKSSRRPTN